MQKQTLAHIVSLLSAVFISLHPVHVSQVKDRLILHARDRPLTMGAGGLKFWTESVSFIWQSLY